MNNDNNPAIDFNKLAAYLDGNLPSEEMASLESYISSDVRLSSMVEEISELDNQIIDNTYSPDAIFESQLSAIELPNVEMASENDIFSNTVDSSDELWSSLFTDSLSPLNDQPIDFSDDGFGDMTDDNSFDDF